MLADVRHLVIVLVDAGLAQGVAEKRLQGPRGARGDNHAVQTFFLYLVRYLAGGVRRTGEKLLLGVDDVGERLAVLHRARNVDDAADVRAAVADENADPGLFLGDVLLFGVDPLLREVAAPVLQHFADLASGSGGGEDRLRDVDRALEGARDEDAPAVRQHGVSRVDVAEVVLFELDAELLRDLLHILRRVHADREDDHVELFLDDPGLGCRVFDGDVMGHRVFFDYGGVAPEEADAGERLRPLVVAFEVLAVGAHVVVEDRALRICVMVLRQYDLLLGVCTAYRRAVRVAALDHLARSDTLDPGNVVGVLEVRLAQDLARVRAGRAQKALVVHAGDDVLKLAVAVLFPHLRVEGLETRGKDDGADVDLLLLGLHRQVDRVLLADSLADAALLLLQVQAALVDVRDERDGLREVDMDRLIERYVLVILVRVLHRAVFHAHRTARAQVFLDVTGLAVQCYVKISCISLYAVDFRVGENFDVGVPADLDQLRCENSHRAVVRREGLVELGHVAADRGRLLDEVDPKARRREIERCLDAADAAADDHDIAEVAVRPLIAQVLNVLVERYYVFHCVSPHRG